MPVMDGYAATQALRRQPQWRDLPVIAMTANAMVGDREKALAAGMNDHVAKPIDMEELFATLARWIRRDAGAARAGGKDAAAGSGPPDLPELPELPGVDLKVGLAGMMGDRALYRRLLRLFRDRETDFLPRFLALRAAHDAAAMRMAHDLKSAAAALGMKEVHAAAQALEQACLRDADEAAVGPLAQEVDRVLAPVLAGLQVLGDEAAPSTGGRPRAGA